MYTSKDVTTPMRKRERERECEKVNARERERERKRKTRDAADTSLTVITRYQLVSFNYN